MQAHTITTHRVKKLKTPTPWTPPPAGFQQLQFYRWARLPYIAQLISISPTQRCIFNKGTNILFILLTNILQAAAQHAHRLKVSFLLLLVLFSGRCFDRTCTNPSNSLVFFFANLPQVLIMFWHNYGWGGGGGTIVTMFTRYPIVDRLHVDVRV